MVKQQGNSLWVVQGTNIACCFQGNATKIGLTLANSAVTNSWKKPRDSVMRRRFAITRARTLFRYQTRKKMTSYSEWLERLYMKQINMPYGLDYRDAHQTPSFTGWTTNRWTIITGPRVSPILTEHASRWFTRHGGKTRIVHSSCFSCAREVSGTDEKMSGLMNAYLSTRWWGNISNLDRKPFIFPALCERVHPISSVV